MRDGGGEWAEKNASGVEDEQVLRRWGRSGGSGGNGVSCGGVDGRAGVIRLGRGEGWAEKNASGVDNE
jgi:hypothetical protein